jgi:rhodanese-related sulfurtransferase
VSFFAETHLHADFLSGARQLAIDNGAVVLASAAGRRQFDHRGLGDGDEVDLGGLRLRALATPGHTDEHLAYLLLDGDESLGVFTGGSLLVGSAARTDLVSPERTEELARAQYQSLQRLAQLADEVEVWPTHGAGSFCSAPAGASRTSTMGNERATNTLLAATDEDSFLQELLGSLGSFPPYFLRLGEANRRGPAVLDGAPRLAPLDAHAARAFQANGGEIVDVRPAAAFAAGHPAGALSIPLRPAFASWLGWLAPYDRPLVVLRDDDQDPDEIVWQAAKIGYDNLVGEISGGFEAWRSAGAPVAVIPMASAEKAGALRVLDIRQAAEFEAGHVPGAQHVELGELAERVAEVPDQPTVVMCGHGERAMGAASLLASAGRDNVVVLDGGPDDWAAAHNDRLEGGS